MGYMLTASGKRAARAKPREVVLDDATADLLDLVLERASVAVAGVFLSAQDFLAKSRGRAIPSEGLLAEADSDATTSRAARATGGRKRRGVAMPLGIEEPGIPEAITHPSARSAFLRGFAAAWASPVPIESPYAGVGLGPVCARAWTMGLEAGKRRKAK